MAGRQKTRPAWLRRGANEESEEGGGAPGCWLEVGCSQCDGSHWKVLVQDPSDCWAEN